MIHHEKIYLPENQKRIFVSYGHVFSGSELILHAWIILQLLVRSHRGGILLSQPQLSALLLGISSPYSGCDDIT